MFIRLSISKYRPIQDFNYKPTVTILMSCFNEGPAVFETIQHALASDYPTDKFSIIAIDDCSNDDSWEWMQKAAIGNPNITVIRNDKNLGKSKSLLRALSMADSELILNIDSDGELHSRAIAELASCFVDKSVGGCGGNVMARNMNQNALTEMQSLQYNMAFQLSKVGESFSGSINCISGALFMIRKEIYDLIARDIDERSWLGMEVKEGEDRFMTNLILNMGKRTIINNRAKVFTDVPYSFKTFFSQQLRWRRGFFRTFIWLLKPSVLKSKFSVSSAPTMIRLYGTALLSFLIPTIVTWILIAHGIMVLILLKIYIMILICTISGISYFIARLIGNPIQLSILPFILLPLWTLVDLTFLTALAGLTLGTSDWETRS